MTGAPTPIACLLAALAALSLPLAGCQRAGDRIAEATIERAAEAALARDTGARGPRADARPPRGESLPLPADFPDDVYLPSGYAVNSVMDLEDVSVVSLSVPGKVPALFASAREAMRAQGWQQTLAAQHSVDAAMLAFEKDMGQGQRRATLSFNRNNGDERVIVGVQLRPAEAPQLQ